ncbi:erythromycin esterase-like protein [Pontibacter ummariensis]|uniref:Erythromycin esterase homolog n=1 Tax=Pontibacter ummariensis TaxID=1610492 RepID=A0A239EJN6_9BACT|nr:erythromycin esterase family protein [Pontibacter ummariensis]PRY13264.1 erythromycin esterase-like protein [Pontibacter ummariensis]SNS44102.1 Erythromycin esterase homolog [Pontibacter ummariensis]
MEDKQIKYTKLTKEKDLDVLLEDIGDARIVMLGEGSHGTSEYYTWRTAISKRLIQEKGFNFIAVEGDWPECYALNRLIKGYQNAGSKIADVLQVFRRWPTWMWANWEVAALIEWLRDYNHQRSSSDKAGFYGLDVYSLWESLDQIVHFLENNDGQAVEAARKAINCFEPFNRDPQTYAQATAFVPTDCENEVIEMLQRVQSQRTFTDDPENDFNTKQNALVAVNAEKYYRAMVRGGGSSWNVRDSHMMETLDRLLEFHGPESKAIVWEHNTHIGDASYTDMADDGMFNIGQLAREKYGREQVRLVGFGAYKGTVIAGKAWGAPMQVMEVPEALEGSWEHMLHELGTDDKIVLSKNLRDIPKLQKRIGNRAIGVVYDPKYEMFGNYVPTVVPERYDAFVYFEESEAVHPLRMKIRGGKEPDLYPWNY